MNNPHQKLSQQLVDRGLLAEAGWVAYKQLVYPDATNLSEIQVTETRRAFFAGAQHTFASMMSMLEDGTEPTEKDLNRITLLGNELQKFAEGELAKLMGKRN